MAGFSSRTGGVIGLSSGFGGSGLTVISVLDSGTPNFVGGLAAEEDIDGNGGIGSTATSCGGGESGKTEGAPDGVKGVEALLGSLSVI
jgi:hypothetical protein